MPLQFRGMIRRRDTEKPAEGDGFEVRRQLAQQPDHLHVALAFGLEQPGRTHAMQITVEVELEQRRRSVGWPARVGAAGPGEPPARRSSAATKASRKRTGFSAAM
jgi:hypothetical protein